MYYIRSINPNIYTMKYTITMVLAGILLTLSSCSKEEDVEFIQSDSVDLIIGTWQLQSQTQNGDVVNLDDCNMQGTITFENDLVVTKTFEVNDSSGNCELRRQTQYAYAFEFGSELVFINNNQEFPKEIGVINETTLSFIEDVITSDGFRVTIETIFERQ